MLSFTHKKLIDMYHTKCIFSEPTFEKQMLPWVAEWKIKLIHFHTKGICKYELIGDLKTDGNPALLDAKFLTEEDAQEFCDALNDKHDEWAKKERKEGEIAKRLSQYQF
jgi:hypothetical protein